ncbi:MAG: aminoglycoside adenylyltransferase domain-containing protein, partial [bacterium]
YVVETMCRALYTLAFGELPSKGKAAAWAISALPEPWRSLVEKMVAVRAGETPERATVDDVLQFVQWVAAESQKYGTRA